MPDDASDPDDPGAPGRDSWADDPWAKDAWKRDRWKEADWGKPAARSGDGDVPKRRPGLAGWNASMMEAGPYLSLGLQTAFSMAFFVGLGYVVDRWLGSEPWGLLVGAVLGMVAVIMLLVRLARTANAKAHADREEKKRRGGKRP